MPRHSTNNQQGITWRELTLPVMSGVDLRSNARALPQVRLARLINGSFDERNAVVKRAGHIGRQVLPSGYATTVFPFPPIGTYRWIYGWGRFSPDEDQATQTVWRPVQDQIKDVIVREGQVTAWTGDRLFAYDRNLDQWYGSSNYFTISSDNVGRGIPLYVPAGKVIDLPSRPDQVAVQHQSVRGEKYILTAWLVSNTLWLRVANSDGTIIFEKSVMTGTDSTGNPQTMVTIQYIKALYLGGTLGVLCADSNTSQLWYLRVPETSPDGTVLLDSVTGSGNLTAMNHWDVYKESDTRAAVVYRLTTTVRLTYIQYNGVVQQPAASATSLPLGGFAADGVVAIAVNMQGYLGLVWASGAAAKFRVTTPNGTAFGSVQTLEAAAPARVTCSHYTIAGSNHYFAAYAQVDSGADPYIKAAKIAGNGTLQNETRWNIKIAGSAFTVGEEPCLPAVTVHQGSTTTRQNTYVLQMGIRNPRIGGAWARSQANTFTDIPRASDFLPGQDRYNRTKWVLGFTHNPKYYLASIVDPVGILNREFSIQENRGLRVELDFVPETTWAPFGRCVYFSGAMPKVWDGKCVVEAGFLQYPEHTTIPTAANDAGAAMTPGNVSYRVYFCRKNQWGELARSPAITSAVVNIPDATTHVTLTLSTLEVTEDDQVYYEIYRTLAGGSVYHLISGLDITTAVKNDRTVKEVTYVDTMDDALAATQPVDPFNPDPDSSIELDEVALPGCEILAASCDRLWFAGGEVKPGKVYYSKMKEPDEQAAWNDLSVLEYTLDNSATPITGIGEQNNTIVVFRDRDVLRITGDGPDNLGQGSFSFPPDRSSSDLGALSQRGVVKTPDGLAFWTSEGPRILTESLAVAILGDEVTPAARGRTVKAALVAPHCSQVRWYLDNGTALVYDYVTRFWAVHTGLDANGACYADKGAVLARYDGMVLFEDVSVKSDAGRAFEFIFRTSELRPTELVQGSTRVRRWAATGVWKGLHSLKYRVYYDGAPSPADEGTWNVSSDVPFLEGWGQNVTTTFGTSGDSLWPTTGSHAPDGVYRTRRRFGRQRCATVSLEFSDNFAAGDGFVITEVGLEIGTKDGLTRLPARTYST